MTSASYSGADTPAQSLSQDSGVSGPDLPGGNIPEAEFFAFEADFVESLRCIPMQVRLKLDACGVKLKLEHWHRFDEGDRQRLTQLPGDDRAAYAACVQALVQQVQPSPAATLPVEPHPAWENGEALPPEVVTQAELAGAAVTLDQWRSLSPLQRFALIKLSRPGHENRNFYPALVEFGLAPPGL